MSAAAASLLADRFEALQGQASYTLALYAEVPRNWYALPTAFAWSGHDVRRLTGHPYCTLVEPARGADSFFTGNRFLWLCWAAGRLLYPEAARPELCWLARAALGSPPVRSAVTQVPDLIPACVQLARRLSQQQSRPPAASMTAEVGWRVPLITLGRLFLEHACCPYDLGFELRGIDAESPEWKTARQGLQRDFMSRIADRHTKKCRESDSTNIATYRVDSVSWGEGEQYRLFSDLASQAARAWPPRLRPSVPLLPSRAAYLQPGAAELAQWVEVLWLTRPENFTVSRVATFTKPSRRSDREVEPAAPPAWCTAAVAARGSYPGVPRLTGVVNYPVMLPDGSVLMEPGYHRPSGLLVRPTPGLELSAPDRPTRAEVSAAVAALLDVVCDFPFESPAHQATWLAGLLTLLAYPAFDGPAPLFLIDGNVRGVGKGLLADVIALTVFGHRFSVMSYTDDQAELRKRITTLAVECERAVLLDNLTGPVGNGTLDAALTTVDWKDRLLGTNRLYSGPLHLAWFGTGNNCELAGDLGRRTAPVRLETPEERPEEKTGFKYPDLRQYVRRHRGQLLSAALTLLRGWVTAGRPAAGLPAWGSFEGWSGVVRECVVWAGLPDPGDTRQQLLTRADRETEAVGSLLRELARVDPVRRGLTAAAMVDAAKADPALRAAVEEVADALDARRLGYRLRGATRRVVGGLFLDRAGGGGAGVRWAVYTASEYTRPIASAPAAGTGQLPG